MKLFFSLPKLPSPLEATPHVARGVSNVLEGAGKRGVDTVNTTRVFRQALQLNVERAKINVGTYDIVRQARGKAIIKGVEDELRQQEQVYLATVKQHLPDEYAKIEHLLPDNEVVPPTVLIGAVHEAQETQESTQAA